jgi:hypothetical protein
LKINTLTGIFALYASLFYSSVALGASHGNPDLPFLTQEADVICIGRISSVETSTRVKLDVGYRGRDGGPYLVDAQSAVATVKVENVLKGQLDQAVLQVTFYKNVHFRENPSPFTELISGEDEVLFLVSAGSKATFNLVMPASYGRSKISIGETKTVSSPNLSSLRTVLSAIVERLPYSSQSQREDCLQRLGSAGYLLYVKPGVYTDEYGLKRRLALGEPVLTPQSVPTSLEQFVRDHILPPVMVLARSKDIDVSERAFITLGQLQDATAIPDLIKIADKDYQPDVLGEAALVIGEYKTPVAVRPLINALTSKNGHVRQEAADALRELNNPLALPFLIDRLDDSDPDVRLIASQALFTITGEVGSHLPPGDDQSLPARELAFWKKWAAEHQARIKALRAQFKADVPATSAR